MHEKPLSNLYGICGDNSQRKIIALSAFLCNFAINNNDVSAGKSNRKCHSIYLSRYSLRFRKLRRGNGFLKKNINENQLQKYLRHCTVFWLKWLVHDLVLVTPPPPLFKVASNTRPCSKLGGTTLNGGGGSILSHRPVTSSDLKQDRLFFRESVSKFLQLVEALYMGGSRVPSSYLIGTMLLESYVPY